MTLWMIIMWTVLGFMLLSFGYLGIRIPKLFPFEWMRGWSTFKEFSMGLLISLGIIGLITFCLDFINALVCILYMALIFVFSDFVFWLIEKTMHIKFEHYYAGWIALMMTLMSLSLGWYLDHHVGQTDYTLTTKKDIQNLKVVMFADSHLGTTFDSNGFIGHLKSIEAEHPDILVVVGDYVDDSTTKEDMIAATLALGKIKTTYGIYFVSGNHDKGYFGAARRGFSEADLFDELKKNGIKVLQDESVLIHESFYIIGRKDFSYVNEGRGGRQSISELTKDLDKNKYMIVLDHQPVEFNKEADANVDLVLSGHTHGGQLFPFNQVGKWIGVNDLVYGHERRQYTDFIVTSGISDWAIKFKTGTKSEFVVININ